MHTYDTVVRVISIISFIVIIAGSRRLNLGKSGPGPGRFELSKGNY